MARPPRRMPPSAMDGYRRLERTRAAVPDAAASAQLEDSPPGRSRRRLSAARVAGAVRFVAFVGVLAIIIGTSVSLASSNPQQASTRTSTPATGRTSSTVDASTSSPVTRSARAAKEATTVVESSTAADVAPVATPAAPTEAAATATAPTRRALPVTGERTLTQLLLGGAGIMLLGMLVQISGQPLPARAGARTRG